MNLSQDVGKCIQPSYLCLLKLELSLQKSERDLLPDPVLIFRQGDEFHHPGNHA